MTAMSQPARICHPALLLAGRPLPQTKIKAIEKLGDVHRAQVLTYLKITNCRLGLLINWNVERLLQGVTRVINPYHQP